MAMAPSVDKPDDGGAGGAVMAGQVVEFSWKEEGIYKQLWRHITDLHMLNQL